MRPQTVAASAWPKRKAALCGYSCAAERAQNAPKPGSDTAGVPLAAAKRQRIVKIELHDNENEFSWLV